MPIKSLTEAMTDMVRATDNIKKKRERLVQAVKTGMKEVHWTISRLAQEMNVTQAYMSLILQGNRAGPMPDQLLMKSANHLVSRLQKKGKKKGFRGQR